MTTAPSAPPPVLATPGPRTGSRALVLGGGGSTGNAWLLGVVAGLSAAGVDLTGADLVVGTSAGATAAAQITAAAPSDLLAAALTPLPPRGPAPGGPRGVGGPVAGGLERLRAVIAASADAADLRRRLGEAALARESSADPAVHASWRATVAARLPRPDWPAQALLVTAVDALTGEGVTFSRESGVDLADAVAASCANGFGVPPYPIGGHSCLDGGYRRNENADLAAGHERIVVLSPFGGRSPHPPAWRMQLSAQVEELRAGGSEVVVVAPDRDVEHLFGENAMDLSLRPAAARAGHDQGHALAATLAGFWSGGAP